MLFSFVSCSDNETKTNDSETKQDVSKENEKKEASPIDKYILIEKNNPLGFKIDEKSVSFIENHPKFFPGDDKNLTDMINYVGYDISYAHIKKIRINIQINL